jgi:hypothetical protein
MPTKTISPLPPLHGRKITATQVAKDVLVLLAKKPKLMQFGHFGYVAPIWPTAQTRDEQAAAHAAAQDFKDVLLKEKQLSCGVCALGALFVAKVMRTDDCPFHLESYGRDEVSTKLVSLFSDEQMDLIESAYELYGNQSEPGSAAAFGAKFKAGKPRLKAICQNIIENKGKFKPEKGLKTHASKKISS